MKASCETRLLVQPVYADAPSWTEFAEQEGLYFELLEPFMPQHMDDSAWLETVGRFYQETGRCLSSHGAFIDVNPASGDPRIRELSRIRMEQSCRFAARFGMEHVVFHASAHPFLNGMYLEGWASQCSVFYGDLAARYGVKIHIENSMDYRPDAMELLAKRLDPDCGVDFCLDVGHVNYSGADMAEWLERLDGRVGYLHVSDNHGLFDDHLPAGRGTVDWAKTDALWRACGGTEIVTVEMNSLEDTRETVRFLREHHYFGQ